MILLALLASLALAPVISPPKFLPLMSVSLSSLSSSFSLARVQSSVNYCSHSSRGVKRGQLRVPGWVWQPGTLERHSGDWGARETESWNCRGRDARAHGRFSPPAYWGVPCLSPKPEHRARARLCQHLNWGQDCEPTSLLPFFTFLPSFCVFAFPSLWVQILMWARGAVFPLTVARDGRRRQRLHWCGRTISLRRGEPRWRGNAARRRLQPSRQRLRDPREERSEAPPPTAARAHSPASQRWHRNSSSSQREPPDSLSLSPLVSARAASCVHNTNIFCLLSAQPVVLRTSGCASSWVFCINLIGASNGRRSAFALLVLLGHLGFTEGMQRVWWDLKWRCSNTQRHTHTHTHTHTRNVVECARSEPCIPPPVFLSIYNIFTY